MLKANKWKLLAVVLVLALVVVWANRDQRAKPTNGATATAGVVGPVQGSDPTATSDGDERLPTPTAPGAVPTHSGAARQDDEMPVHPSATPLLGRALQAAQTFLGHYRRPASGTSQQQWLNPMQPLVSPKVFRLLQDQPVEDVLVTRVTGQPVISTGALDARDLPVSVDTDAGEVVVHVAVQPAGGTQVVGLELPPEAGGE